eukprot:SAG31_NODE_108_length_24741_cov_6.933041_8_plen_436_part_00
MQLVPNAPARWNSAVGVQVCDNGLSAEHAMLLAGVYTVDPAAPVANSRMHLSNGRGGHLHALSSGEWALSLGFGMSTVASIAAHGGPLPLGHRAWNYRADAPEQNQAAAAAAAGAAAVGVGMTSHLVVPRILHLLELRTQTEAKAAEAEYRRTYCQGSGGPWPCQSDVEQVRRAAGLRFMGLTPARTTLFGPPFTLDPAAPSANSRPHWSNSAGAHLYFCSTSKEWLAYGQFLPDDDFAVFRIEAACGGDGAVPVGAHRWLGFNDSQGCYEPLQLSVEELDSAALAVAHREVAERSVAGLAAAATQAERVDALTFVSGLPANLSHLFRDKFTVCKTAPTAHDRPHYTNGRGHLYYSGLTGKWFLSSKFLPETKQCFGWFATEGEVPATGEPVPWVCKTDEGWLPCAIAIREIVEGEAMTTMTNTERSKKKKKKKK